MRLTDAAQATLQSQTPPLLFDIVRWLQHDGSAHQRSPVSANSRPSSRSRHNRAVRLVSETAQWRDGRQEWPEQRPDGACEQRRSLSDCGAEDAAQDRIECAGAVDEEAVARRHSRRQVVRPDGLAQGPLVNVGDGIRGVRQRPARAPR